MPRVSHLNLHGEEELTVLCAGNCLFAHDEGLDVRVPSGGPAHVCDRHQIVLHLRPEEL